jgi:hypothetical protein
MDMRGKYFLPLQFDNQEVDILKTIVICRVTRVKGVDIRAV